MEYGTKYSTSPFDSEMKADLSMGKKTYFTKSGGKAILDTSTGELTNTSAVYLTFEAKDSNQFIKIFVKDIDILNKMTPAGIKLFTFIVKGLEKNTNSIVIRNTDLIETYKVNKNTAVAMIKELIELNLIAKSDQKYKFWVNTKVMFNGDRTKL